VREVSYGRKKREVSYGRERRKEGSSRGEEFMERRKEVKCIQCYREEFTGRRASQIRLQNTKMHCIEILGLDEVMGDAPRLGSSPFMSKERHAYFDTSLILRKGRHTLLMLISIYPFPSLETYTYMRAHLPLLDLRCTFKGSSPIYSPI
jgi:hypothetical protein